MEQLELLFDFRPEHLQGDMNDKIKSFEPMIYKLSKSIVFNANSSDVCMEREDVINYGRMLVWEAINEYKPDRGAKLSTFVHLKLFSKFLNLARKIKTRAKNGSSCFSSFVYGDESHDNYEQNEDADPCYILHQSKDNPEEAVNFNQLVDGIISRMNNLDKNVFTKSFLEGHGTNEIKKMFKSISSYSDAKILIERVKKSAEATIVQINGA